MPPHTHHPTAPTLTTIPAPPLRRSARLHHPSPSHSPQPQPGQQTPLQPTHHTPLNCPRLACKAIVVHQHPPDLQYWNPRPERRRRCRGFVDPVGWEGREGRGEGGEREGEGERGDEGVEGGRGDGEGEVAFQERSLDAESTERINLEETPSSIINATLRTSYPHDHYDILFGPDLPDPFFTWRTTPPPLPETQFPQTPPGQMTGLEQVNSPPSVGKSPAPNQAKRMLGERGSPVDLKLGADHVTGDGGARAVTPDYDSGSNADDDLESLAGSLQLGDDNGDEEAREAELNDSPLPPQTPRPSLPRPNPHLCTSPLCPIIPAHNAGPYLTHGQIPQLWNEDFGWSNPPAEVWEAWNRVQQEYGEAEDFRVARGFSWCHWWDGGEGGGGWGV